VSDPLRLVAVDGATLAGESGRAVDVVREARPDVVAVRNAPRRLRWRSKRAAIARRLGLVVATTDRPGGLVLLVALRAQVGQVAFVRGPERPERRRRSVVSAVVEVSGAQWRIVLAEGDVLSSLGSHDPPKVIVTPNKVTTLGDATVLSQEDLGVPGAVLAVVGRG
jgi:hypothetical protein